MSDNDMIRNALAKYARLHEAAQQVQANQKEYCELYSWLITTQSLFPDAFKDTEPVSTPLPSPAIRPVLTTTLPATTKVLSSEPSPSLGEMIGAGLVVAHNFNKEIGLGIRRKLNADALNQVEQILRASPKQQLPLGEIVAKMADVGWEGYPLNDGATALYNALMAKARNEERFKNLGDNVWALLP